MEAQRKRMTGAERRKCILESAKKAFAEHGMDGARTRDIAAACGVNEALLYRHFSSKEDLFVEAMSDLYTELDASWTRAPEAARSGLEAVHNVAESQLRICSDNPQICANLLHSIACCTHSERVKELVRAWTHRNLEFWVDLLRRGMEDGSVRANMIPERVARSLSGGLWMYIIRVITGLEPDLDIQLKHVHSQIDTFIAAGSPDFRIAT